MGLCRLKVDRYASVFPFKNEVWGVGLYPPLRRTHDLVLVSMPSPKGDRLPFRLKAGVLSSLPELARLREDLIFSYAEKI